MLGGYPLWFPMFGGLWFALAVFVLWLNWGWWRNPILGFWAELTFPLLIGGMIFAMLFAGAMGAAAGLSEYIGNRTASVWRECWRANLASIRNADGVQGSISGGIFVLSGHIGSSEVYYYYTTDCPDRYKPRKHFPNSDTTIIEEERADGEVVQFDTAFRDPSMYRWAWPNDRLRMDFHIPRGSLAHQFSIK